ncbi:uncharacterized protein LOC110618017 [Manihot esculenta]|uniref:DUF7032 domain-containing protein n=1 Tax=Manihot esculenta TaxID=3983 RepID=A0A2C9VRQ1_MANES|nr:uncharacterized protein LOC110618017 [Manihot esculenta]OAY48017.1 hypothetical protein MANES_06G124800v8 [Manihot esculenta]
MKVSENDPIKVSKQLLQSLLDEIVQVHIFKGKWALIRTKLADLHTQLTDFADFPASTSNPLCLDLLHSISHSLNDAILMAKKCQTPNLTEGKLRTQSDVDSVLAKLDRHVKDSEILIKSGVLQDNVIPGSFSSKREAVRAESRNLITRLQIGTSESKNSAMDSLLRLVHEDDKNVMIAVAQGVVPVLVRLLDSCSQEMKEKIVAAISRVSTVDSSKHVLIAEGLLLLNHLLRVLESGSGYAKEKACVSLQSLTFSKENARAIGSRGGISSLLEICQGGTPGSQGLAAGVLRNLAVFEEIRENFIEENAVFVLIGLAVSGTALAQENAIGCLCNLAKDDENLKLLIVKEGGIDCLRNFWDSAPPVRSLEVAINLLRHLASSQVIAEVLVSEGFILRLVAMLNCGVMGVRIAAARAVYELGFNTKTKMEMGECGIIVPLIKMLDGKPVEEKEAAAKALSHLVLYAGNRRIFRKDERGIVSAVLLLDPLMHNLDKKYPVSILASLVHSKKCRKQMIAAGACVHLKKLVEMDVEGAKKLSDSLGRGKIWGVFARP